MDQTWRGFGAKLHLVSLHLMPELRTWAFKMCFCAYIFGIALAR